MCISSCTAVQDTKCLPVNTTSVLQPIDQRIIKIFKFYYRRCPVNRYIATIENRQGNDEIKISVRDAVNMSTMALNEVEVSTIANCFRKVGFEKQIPGDVAEHKISFQEAADELQYEGVDDTIWNSIQDYLGFSTTFEEYVDIDSQICTPQELTEKSIVESEIATKAKIQEEIKEEDEEMKEEEDDLPEDNVPSNTAQYLEAISGIRAFFQSLGMPENVFDALTVLQDLALQLQIFNKKKQCKIPDLIMKKEQSG